MTKDFLTGISGISGGSGYESGAAGYIKKEFEKYSTDVTIDGHYNVTARKTQCGCKWVVPKVLICAHMDEVSLMVKSVDENGFIRTGWYLDGDKYYYFDENGVMLHDTDVEGYHLGSDGVMQ